MNFSLFKLDYNAFPFQQSKIKKTWKIFMKKDDDVSLFNWTKISANSYHVVFHISDEHYSGTKKGGESFTLPFSQYVNSFLVNGVLFIEAIKKNYVELIKEYVNTEFNLDPAPLLLDNEVINGVIKKTDGFIKKIEYCDSDGEDYNESAINIDQLEKLSKEFTIEYVSFLYNDTFISLTRPNRLSINSGDEEELLNAIEAVSNAIN